MVKIHYPIISGMHTYAHEAVRSLCTAWAERMIETRNWAMTLCAAV